MKSKAGKQYLFRFIFTALGVLLGTQIIAAQVCDVTWRKADNPRTISGTQSIPAGQTVCAEPGVRVQFASNGKLLLLGRLTAVGAANDRIIFAGQNVFPNRVEVLGTLDLQFADISVPFNVNPGGSLTCRDCNVSARGGIFTLDGIVFSYTPKFISVENSTFDSNEEFNSDNAAFYVSDATIVLRNTTFRNGAYCNIGKSNLYIDNITSQNARFDGIELLQNNFQPQFLNNLSVTNAGDAGLHLLAGNFEIGQNVLIQNNEYPIRGGGGLLPGSNVPASGNEKNWIELTGFQPYSIYAPFAIPYVAEGGRFSNTQILPGVTIKAKGNLKFETFGNPHVEILGLPNAPIIFEQFTPGVKWHGLEFFQDGDRTEYVVFDGSQFGAQSTSANDTSTYFDQTVFRNHDVALNNQIGDLVYVQGSLFTNNGIAVRSEGNNSTYRMSGETNPNLFENNGVAVRSVGGALTDVRFNWWNSPTGPTTPLNPGGTGDRIEGNPQFQPFRTVRPDRTDHPPVVRLPRRPFLLTAGSFEGVVEPGQKVILKWDAFDNNTIVKQKILLSLDSNIKENFIVVADNLPGNQRSFEFTMPASAGTSGGFKKFIRIVAVDDKGQEGFEEWQVQVPTGTEPGVLQITTPLGGETFRSGSEFHVNWTITTPFNDPTFQVFLILDGNRQVDLAANGNSTGTFSTVKIPYISTDSARIAVKSQGSINNVKWFYSQPFAIRPDSRFPDTPPQVELLSPVGQNVPVGSVVPIAWTASDNEALRQFNILYSTDGGRTWLTLVENLPPTQTSYNWQTPPTGTGFSDVRVRVVAIDRRFQNSSDGYNRSFQITAAQGNQPPTVQITFPANNAAFGFGQSIFLAASAQDADGTIQRVEFYDGANLIGSDASAPYQIGWNYPQTTGGSHTITARAVDNLGATTNSAPITVTFITTGGPTPLPVATASLTSPANEAVFDAPATITVSATAGGSTQGVSRVDFFLDTTLVGTDTTAPYSITINNVPAGRHTIFARTTAGNGVQAISQGVDITVRPAITRRTPFDFDGDGRADISVFRPDSGVWYLQQSTGGFTGSQFGIATDKLVPADYDGDGKTDLGVYRDGTWYLLRSSTGFTGVQFGLASDIPQTGDFDGDGKADLAVFRPSDGTWYLQQSAAGFAGIQFGANGDRPVAADFDGDGKTDVAVYRAGVWYVLQSRDGFRAIQFGVTTDKPVASDYDGDGKSDFAVYRDGVWYQQRSSQGFTAIQFGVASDIPAPSDYDGDGKTDIAVFRGGTWYIQQSTAGFFGVQFGLASDVPVPSSRVP